MTVFGVFSGAFLARSMRQVRRFHRNIRGSIAIIASTCLVFLVVGAGMAVDFVRASEQQQALNHAIDAAALAVANSSLTDQADLEELARNYISANLSDVDIAELDLTITITDDKVSISANRDMPTTLMQIASIETMTLTAFTEVTRAVTNTEVVLVLDNTGSMASNGKLAALKEAATDLTDILFGDETQSETLKMGVVPFAVSVNDGPQYTSETWLDHNGLNAISHLNFSDSSKHNSWAWNQLDSSSWNGCVEQRKVATGIDYDIDDTTPDVSNPDTLFPIYFAPDEPSDTNNASSMSGYGGGFVNSYMSDWLASETVSTSTKKSTSLSNRQRRYEKYVGASVNAGSGTVPKGPGYLCGTAALTPLTGTKQTVTDALDDMVAIGGTNIASGIGWGLRVLSPTAPFTEGADYDDDDWNKIMIIMTDGDNDWGNVLSNMNNSYYGGYGYASQVATRLGLSSTPTTDAALDNILNLRTTAACDEVKSATGDADHPVTVYTITFGTSLTNSAKTLMEDCATDSEKYFHAPDNATLEDVFDTIATEIKDVYLSK
jgi:Flp pilus assembly protein TadG